MSRPATPAPQFGAQRFRIIAPDVARGLALFGIAWTNLTTAWAVAGNAVPAATFGGVVDGSVPDQIFAVLSAMFAHVRGLPMFTTLLGFGVGLITLSLSRRGYPPRSAVGVLVRRYGLLALFGVVHLLLLFFGDIMTLYGVLGMLLAVMITFRDRTLLWIGGVLLAIGIFFGLGAAVAVAFLPPEIAAKFSVGIPEFSGYREYLGFNVAMLVGQLMGLPGLLTQLFPLMILGFVAARRGVHRDPRAFARQLWLWVVVAVAVIVFIGLPWGLSAVGVLPTAWELPLSMANNALGYLTGPGIAAAILLACQPLQERVQTAGARGERVHMSLPLEMITALGKRSMSGYLMQSVLFFILVLPFTLDLADGLGAAGMFVLSLGVWLVTVLGAWALEKAGKSGPFEWAHRRLSYGRAGLLDQWVPKDQRGRQVSAQR